jgi:TRAP-type C4-dicarboxylate transport system substrate-binding protein
VFHYFSTRDYASDYTLTRHSYDTGAIVANHAWWASATPSQRNTLDHAWMSSAEARASVRKLTAFCLDDMRKRGVRVHELTPAQRDVWRKATASIAGALIDEIGGESETVWRALQDGKRAYAAGAPA